MTAPATQTAPSPAPASRRWRRNPWGHPWFLEGFTWLYLIWSLVPIAIAVLFSFNKGKSQATYQGVSWHWYFRDPNNSVLHNPQLHAAVIQTVRLSVLTTVIAVPLGLAFALGIPVRRVLTRLGVYRFVWHRGLFDIALLILLWTGVSATAAALTFPT